MIQLENLVENNQKEFISNYKKYNEYYKNYMRQYPASKKHEVKQRFIDSFGSYKNYLEYCKENNRKYTERLKERKATKYKNNFFEVSRAELLELKQFNPAKYMWKIKKANAKNKGIEFTIQPEHIIIPEYCPVLGIKLEFGTKVKKENSPSIDRFDNSKGYIPGNIRIISWKANRLKSNATIEELEKVLYYMKNDLI